MTWYLGRLFRSGPACAVMTFLIPAALAALVNSQRTQDEVLGIMLVAAGIVFIGSVAGSAVTACLGIALFSMGALLAEPPTPVLLVVGAGLFTAMVVHDLAGAFHRDPRITRAVWTDSARTTVAVLVASAAIFGVSFGVGALATWQSIVVPFAIAAIGFAAKLAADSHRAAARTLTAKATVTESSERLGGDSSG